ncbi:MAG: HD domain-containing protein [Anaerolineales bacterium]|nr:HD domain-containing protein [Anaerolineales bacterium]MCX7753916.1 HD domain-containing protein [Anaerolineales bacterium]MDW8277995.1 HD domain-containing protein [Anaerolineales bacterium]
MNSQFDERTGNLLTAVHFAAFKHRDQRRKDQALSPYINHPLEVARLLWEVGSVREEATLIAAILHDTIEDTDTTPDDIRQTFGEDVLGLVLEVTDDKSLPKARRKQLQIETAPHLSLRAKLIKLADKISNVYDLLHSPPRRWSLERKQRYLLWTEQVVTGLRGVNPALEHRYDELLQEGKHCLQLDKEVQ